MAVEADDEMIGVLQAELGENYSELQIFRDDKPERVYFAMSL